MRSMLAVVLFGVACQGPQIRPVSPEGPAMVSARGTVVSIAVPAGDDWRIVLEPDAASRGLMREGQRQLVCELPASYADVAGPFEKILPKIQVGGRLEVSGYHVVDDGEGGDHKIRPWTSLDVHVR